MYYLEEAIKTGKPAGLRVFGENWNTLYEALPHLPDKIKNSWYAFDHYYSDSAYPAALPIIFERHPQTILDIGTNIGKFAILAAQYDPDIKITMVDLPDQLDNAIAKVNEAGLENRVESLALDLLDKNSLLPGNIDIYWLSQFLSCFGKDEIISILKRIANVMHETSRVYVMETCWDLQQHEPAAFALINTSLYFTAMASGNSKMYHSSELIECFNAAGLSVTKTVNNLGICSTPFECKKSG
jgi:ribosomal protein L11 methylase PrmA